MGRNVSMDGDKAYLDRVYHRLLEPYCDREVSDRIAKLFLREKEEADKGNTEPIAEEGRFNLDFTTMILLVAKQYLLTELNKSMGNIRASMLNSISDRQYLPTRTPKPVAEPVDISDFVYDEDGDSIITIPEMDLKDIHQQDTQFAESRKEELAPFQEEPEKIFKNPVAKTNELRYTDGDESEIYKEVPKVRIDLDY